MTTEQLDEAFENIVTAVLQCQKGTARQFFQSALEQAVAEAEQRVSQAWLNAGKQQPCGEMVEELESQLRSRLAELLCYIEESRPSDFAPWRKCDCEEMLRILKGDSSTDARCQHLSHE